MRALRLLTLLLLLATACGGRVYEARGVVRGVHLDDGEEIVHTVATFLIDPDGRIAGRYLGLEHEPQALLEDLLHVL